MGLHDLNQDLYSRDAHLDRSRSVPADAPSPEAIAKEREAFQQADTWAKPAAPSTEDLYIEGSKEARRRQFIRWGLIGVAVIAVVGALGAAGYLFFQRQSAVNVTIDGPREVASAEPVSFTVTYSNDSWGSIGDAALSFTLPPAFRPEPASGLAITGRSAEVKVGELASGAAGKFTLTGTLYGSKGEQGEIEAVLRYVPQATSGQFESRAALPVTIATSPLLFEIEAPLELVSGQEADYVVTYENRSQEPIRNVRIELTYPEGFQFLSADQKPESGDNAWYLPELRPLEPGKIVVHGVLNGGRNEFRRVSGEIGIRQGDGSLLSYNQAERPTKMIASPLTITQTVNGQGNPTVYPGDILTYVIQYKNEGSIGVRDVIVTHAIDTAYLDVANLQLESGAYDPGAKKITWRASDLRDLADLQPGETGQITFAIPVLRTFSLAPNTGSTISVRSLSTIDSPDVPAIISGNKVIGSNLILLKLGALVSFDVVPVHTDANIPNSGPVPPKVGEETTYTLRLRLENSSNELVQSRAVLAFPSGVEYKKKSFPGDASVAWNSRTNELSWEVGTLSPGKPRDLSVQVGIRPNLSQAGNPVELVKRATFTAKDTFTNKEVRTEKGAVNNNLGAAESGSQKSGQVGRP